VRGVIVKNLTKTFGSVIAVSSVNFDVEPGEALALLGPSGCGKTTVLRCIAGLEIPDEGEIIIGNKIVFSRRNKIHIPPNKRNIGMVFQSYALWPHMTVYKNIAYPLEIRKWSRSDIDKRVKELVDLLGLTGLENRYPSQLSGGQQQRVALARAIAYPVDLLLLDEPLSNVDARLRESLRLEIRNIQRKLKITMIYVTHDRLEALTIADKIGIMNKGKLIELGKPGEILRNPRNSFVAEFLGYIRLFEGIIGENRGALARVKTKSGLSVICRNPASLTIGEKVSIYVTNVRIGTPENKGYDNLIRAYVKDLIELGALIEYQIETPEGSIVMRVPPNNKNIELIGETYIAFRSEDCYVLKD
jgi:iron(III) transport system ATP-binding protein